MSQLKESRNPLFVRLTEQVLLEHNLYKQREHGRDYLATLLCDFIYQPPYIESCLAEFQTTVGSRSLSIDNLFEFAICIKLAHKFQLSTSIPDDGDIKYNLAELAKTNSYPSSLKSSILFLLKGIPHLSSAAIPIEEGLLIEAHQLKKARRFDTLPDLLFGCQDNNFFSRSELQELLTGYIASWTREKLSKFILFLQSNESPPEELDDLVRILEAKVEEEFNSWIEPDIWFSIIESEKLINSNISEEDLRILLKNLKDSKVSWSEAIEEIEKDGVFLKLQNFTGKGGFASFEDALTLISLKQARREFIFALNELDVREYQKLKNAGADGLSKNGVTAFVIVNMFSVASIMIVNDQLNVGREIKTLLNINFSPSSIKELLYLLLQAPLISLLLIFWNINLWTHLRSNRTLRAVDLVAAFPFVKKIKTFFE